MSRVTLELCNQVLNEYYGDIVAVVGTFLLKKKSSNLATISNCTGIDIKQVKQIITALIQQNIVSFLRSTKGNIVEYEANIDAVLWRLRFPHYIHCAKRLYGDAAELIVEDLLIQGQTMLGSVVKKTTDKLNQSLISSGSSLTEISPHIVQEKAITLVKARLIRRCEDVIKDGNNRVIALNVNSDPELLFRLPSASDFKLEPSGPGEKREVSNDSKQSSAKRIKLESGESSESFGGGDADRGSGHNYWQVNVYQFHHQFRDQAIITAVAKTIDLRASEVMRTMLRLSETKTIPTSQESEHLTFTEIFGALPKDKVMTSGTLDQYLKCLAENCNDFVTKIGESSGGVYQINFFKAVEAICISQIKTIVLERFGSKALRCFNVLMVKKNVEQKQVEDQAMLSPKEAKELLYKMFAENFVSLTELSKAPDHAPARTFYLFSVNLIQLVRMLLEKCYQAILNVKIKREKSISENKRLLDKQDRVETIIASLDAEGAIEQKEEVEQMVTPSERAQLLKISKATKQLDQSELQLDDSIFIFETFLSYTLNPPPPK